MSPRLLIGLIIFFSFTFVALLGGLVWVMQHHPEYLGLPRPVQDSTQVVDTLALMQQKIDSLQQALQHQQDSLLSLLAACQDTTALLRFQKDSLTTIILTYQQQDSLRQLQQLFQADSLILATKKRFAQIYNQANPEDVAKILANLDDKDAAEILLLMDQKQAAKVLGAMDPERAARILALSTTLP